MSSDPVISRLGAALALLVLLPGLAAATEPTDPAIARIVARVSPERLRSDDGELVAFGTRSTFSETAPPGRGVVAARDWLVHRFETIAAASGGRMSVALDRYVQPADGKRVPREVEISNVIATLRGDEAGGRTYVLSAHYDSRNSDNSDGEGDAPGADDNGSGTVAVLEAARALADVRLRATVLFAIYDAEEQGLFGSKHHAEALKSAGLDVEGDLNNDIVGASAGDGKTVADQVRIFSEALPAGADPAQIDAQGGENDSPSRELARFAKATGDRYVSGLSGRLIYRADRFLRGGDQESFTASGFPAIRFVEPIETFAHQHQNVRVENGVQYGDLEQFMDFAYLAQVTRYDLAVLASLALGPGRPGSASIVTRELTNQTTLTWAAVSGAVRYEIVRRDTDVAQWSGASDGGTGTTVTLPFSKDNVLFGICAVDAEGHRSVASFPRPQR